MLQANPHWLFWQVAVACETWVVHGLLHIAQFFGSEVVSTHVIPQSVGEPAGQPDVHEYVAPDPAQWGACGPHAAPHAPQLPALSIGVSHP